MATFEFNINPKAEAILALLNSMYLEGPCDGDDYTFRAHAYHWINGREKGIAITIEPFVAGKPGCLTVVFGEHRNSDSIFVDTWIQEHGYFNAPAVQDFPEEAYQARKSFGPHAVGQAAEHIARLVSKHIKACMKARVEREKARAKKDGKPAPTHESIGA